MAYLNAGYLPSGYAGPRWYAYGIAYQPTDSAYVNKRWLASGYTSPRYIDTTILAGGAFIAAGVAATTEVDGFAGGMPWTQQGSSASAGVSAHYSGFQPDPGGILDNDSDPDGDPLSYVVLTQPEVGTLNAYAGGAFDWNFPVGTPIGRYSWTYQLYAGGEAGGIGTVTMEHGDLFASVGVEGFNGQFGTAFDEQGTSASVLVTGFSGEMLLTIDASGSRAETAPAGNAGDIVAGFIVRGTAAEVGAQGFIGGFFGTFDQQGSVASVECVGFAGTLDVGVFFSEQGIAAANDVEGFAGGLVSGGFDEAGTAAVVGLASGAGNLRFGLADLGIAAAVGVSGLMPANHSGSANRVHLKPIDRRVRVGGKTKRI